VSTSAHLAARKAAALAQLEIEFAEVSSGEAA
jgi:hypothetical protein